MILHEIQDLYGYVPLARIYEVITFYHFFKVKAPGKHKIAL